MNTEIKSPTWVRNGALAKYFDVSDMCIHRWKRDEKLGAPKASEINGKEWNDLAAWDAWMRDRVIAPDKYKKQKQAASTEEARPPRKKARA